MFRPPGRRASWVQACTAGVAVALALTACGGDDDSSSDGRVTVTWANWATAEQATKPAIEQVIEDFEAKHPDIRIESEAIAFSDIAQQLVMRTQSGNPPDVAQLAGNDTVSLADTGALAPLDDFVDDELRARMNPVGLENGTHGGELLAFPWLESPQGFWYNKKLMAQAGLDPDSPPATIEELNEALAAIKETFPDSTPLAMDTTNRVFGLETNWAWMKTFGAEPFTDDGAQADSEEFAEYLSWMRDLSENDYIVTGPVIGEFRPLAAQNEVAFMWDQNLLQGVIQDSSGMSDQEFYETWGVTTLPAGPSGESYAADLGHQLVMFGQSEHKEAAWTFIEYLATSDNAILNYTLDAGAALPPLAEPQGRIAEAMSTPINDTFRDEIMPTYMTPPYGQQFSEAYDSIMAGLQQVLASGSDPEDVANEIHDRLEPIIR